MCQRHLALHVRICKGCAAILTYNRTISRLSRQQCLRQDRNHVPKWASTEGQNFWSCILDNLTAMEHRLPRMNLSAAFNGKNATDDVASSSYNWAPTQRQQFQWMLRTLHSNDLHCAVSKSSFTWSVFTICSCIQLPKYACNILQIWFFCL